MKLRILFELGRVSNLPTVWTNMTAGWFLGGGDPASYPFLWALLGGSLLYLSGMAMNDACDAGWDRLHKGERPIARGMISRSNVWILTGFYAASGVIVTVILADACPWLVAGLACSISLYNVLHKRWAGSTWFMGLCRAFLYLVAASAAVGGGYPSVDSVIWGAALGVYIVGLTYIARGEGSGAPLIRWPLALLGAPLLAVVYFAISGWSVWTLLFAVAFLVWTVRSLVVLRVGGEGRIGRAVGFLLAGMVFIDALAVSSGWPYLSFGFVVFAPLLILFQRFIAAT